MSTEDIVTDLVLVGFGVINGGFSGAIAAKNARGLWSAFETAICVDIAAAAIFCFIIGFFNLPFSQGIRITSRCSTAFAVMFLIGWYIVLVAGAGSLMSSSAAYLIFRRCSRG